MPYIPKFSYEEVLADVANQPDDPKNINLFTYVQAVTERVFGVTTTASQIPIEVRRTILAVYAGTQTNKQIDEAARQASIIEQRVETTVQQRVAAQTDALRRELEIKRAQGVPHAFVLIPIGVKTGVNGELIDFDRVYRELMAPALRDSGLEAVRPDEEVEP